MVLAELERRLLAGEQRVQRRIFYRYAQFVGTKREVQR